MELAMPNLILFQPPVTGSSKTTSSSHEKLPGTIDSAKKTRSARSKKLSMDQYMELLLDRLRSIEASQSRAEVSRKEQYESIHQLVVVTSRLSDRLDALEKKFEEISPTLTEYTTMKTQAVGAGRLGRFLWVTGTAIMGLAVWLATFWDNIVKFFNRLTPL